MKTCNFCPTLLSVLSSLFSTSLSLSSSSTNTSITLSPSTSTSSVFCQTFWLYSQQCFFNKLRGNIRAGPRTVSSWTLSASQHGSPSTPTYPRPRWTGSISGIIILYPVYQVDRFLALYWNVEYKARVTARQAGARPPTSSDSEYHHINKVQRLSKLHKFVCQTFNVLSHNYS